LVSEICLTKQAIFTIYNQHEERKYIGTIDTLEMNNASNNRCVYRRAVREGGKQNTSISVGVTGKA
jgi:hypothetical protein